MVKEYDHAPHHAHHAQTSKESIRRIENRGWAHWRTINARNFANHRLTDSNLHENATIDYRNHSFYMSTFSEIAQAWGCSRQAVAKWVKKGMPISSLEAATSWRLGHGQRSARVKLLPTVSAPEPVDVDDCSATVSTIDTESPEAVRDRARKAERIAYALFQERVRAKDLDGMNAALKGYATARAGRAGAEMDFIKHQEAKNVLVDREKVMAINLRRINALKEHLLSLPDALAKRCNPSDPSLAAEMLSEWVERTLRTVSES